MAKDVTIDYSVEGMGSIPEPIEPQDTEPNLFAGQRGNNDRTVPRCIYCGRSSFDVDDAFERGIVYALVQIQGLYQSKMPADEAEHLVNWLRASLLPGAA